MFQGSLYVAFGGAIGTLARFWIAQLFTDLLGPDFPWGTVFINITGCFVIGAFGFLTGPDDRFPVSHTIRQMVIVGFCGGYTTFSSFSLQTLNMLQKGAWGQALFHIMLSVVMCMLAVWAGYLMAAYINNVTVK